MFNILDAIAKAGTPLIRDEVIRLQREAHDTLLALVAHLLTADGQYDKKEQVFFNALVDVGLKPNRELAILREETERWRTIENKIPEFFRTAVAFDLKHGEETARGIMREIQLIGNNTSVSDDEMAVSESEVVWRYLRVLDEYLERESGDKAAWNEPERG